MNNSTHPKWYGLDHLRSFAIFFVFLFHYQILSKGQPGWLPDVARFGWTGVDLFFVLSGFLISSQLFAQIRQGEKIRFREFLLKRFFRIIPAYWVVVGIYFCCPFFREKEALPPIWKFWTFTQNLDLNLMDYGTFSHAWSLCVEEHFYLFLPLILIFLQFSRLFKKSHLLLIALFLLGFGLRMYSYDQFYFPMVEDNASWMYWYKYLYYPSYNRLDGLLVGVSIAGFYQFKPGIWHRISTYGNQWLMAGLGLLTGAYFLCDDAQSYDASVFGFPLVALGYGLVVMGAISPTSILYQWKSKATTFIASLSYAIYLTHKGVIHMTHVLLSPYGIGSNWMLLIGMITCIMGALLLHVAIEKPFMKLRSRVLAMKATHQPVKVGQ